MGMYVFSILSFLYVSVFLYFPLTEGSPSLAKPQNVRVVSYNMGAVLKWDVPPNPPSDQVYRAEVKGLYAFQGLCLDIREQQCDSGQLPSCHGHYRFRVRAELRKKVSNWSYIDFTPITMTIIGPPTVAVVAKGDTIKVTIQAPALKISSLGACYSGYTYFVRYWRADSPQNVTSGFAEAQVSLRSLEPETRYCLQARVYITPYQIHGQYSNTTCVTIPAQEKRWSGMLVVILVVVAVALPLLLLTAWLIQKGRRFLNPKVNLPEHFKQHLFEAPCAHIILGHQDTTMLQEQCDTISTFYEEHPYYDITHQTEKGEEWVLFGNTRYSEEITQYCNTLVASGMSYRNI